MVKWNLPSQVRQVHLRRELTEKGLIVGNEGILQQWLLLRDGMIPSRHLESILESI
jgi:hypothetical protein